LIVTLRKAHQYQKIIRSSLYHTYYFETHRRAVAVPHSVITVFEDVEKTIQKHYASVVAAAQRRERLLAAYYDIQQQTITANAQNGIKSMLNQIAYINTRLEQLKVFIYAPPIEPPEVLAGFAEKLTEYRKWRTPHSEISGIMTPAQIEDFRTQVRMLMHKRRRLTDKVLHLNMTTKITLSDATVAVLTDEKIIA